MHSYVYIYIFYFQVLLFQSFLFIIAKSQSKDCPPQPPLFELLWDRIEAVAEAQTNAKVRNNQFYLYLKQANTVLNLPFFISFFHFNNLNILYSIYTFIIYIYIRAYTQIY